MTLGRTCQSDRHHRTLCPRMARGAGGVRLCRIRCGTRQILACTPEQTMALADEDSPVFMGAVGESDFGDVARRTEDFRSIQDRQAASAGTSAAECLFCGTARFFRTGYKHHLVQEWLPALDGVVEKLEARRQGRRCRLRPWRLDAADGGGFSEIPLLSDSTTTRTRSRRARQAAAKAGLGDRVRFDVRVRQDLSRQQATTSSASSTACTTWAIRSAR